MVFIAELASSNRTSCTLCDEKLPMHTPRFSVRFATTYGRGFNPGFANTWVCTGCLPVFRAEWNTGRCFRYRTNHPWKWFPPASLNSGSSVEIPANLRKEVTDERTNLMRTPATCGELYQLLDWGKLKKDYLASKPPKKPEHMTSAEKSKKRAREGGLDVQGVIDDDAWARICSAKKEFGKKMVAELKKLCFHHNMCKTGIKAELVDRLAEARVLGVLPWCRRCCGFLELDRESGALRCRGSYLGGRGESCSGPGDEPIVRKMHEGL